MKKLKCGCTMRPDGTLVYFDTGSRHDHDSDAKPNFVIMPVDGAPVWSVETYESAMQKTREVIGDVALDHFRGEVDDRVGFFWVDDGGFAKGLSRNTHATAAYRKQCKPEFWDEAVIVGPAVGMFEELAS